MSNFITEKMLKICQDKEQVKIAQCGGIKNLGPFACALQAVLGSIEEQSEDQEEDESNQKTEKTVFRGLLLSKQEAFNFHKIQKKGGSVVL